MTVRTLNKSDIPFLVSACREFPDAWNESMLLSAFRAGNFYGFIAEDFSDGKSLPIGFITYSVNIDTADLQDLFVAAAKRRQGVANALLSAFKIDAEKRGVKKLFLEVRESNAAAISLYLKAGFNFVSTRKKYYADGENALIYVKEL